MPTPEQPSFNVKVAKIITAGAIANGFQFIASDKPGGGFMNRAPADAMDDGLRYFFDKYRRHIEYVLDQEVRAAVAEAERILGKH